MDIRDIAARSGYGVGTVSRAINGQPNVSDRARERILAVMAECGYEPNSNARYLKMRSQTPVTAFVMGVGNRLFDDIIGPLQTELADKDEEMAVMVFLGGEPRYFRESFHEIEVPCVLVTNSAADLGFDNLSSVTIDNEAAAARAVEHLWERGHRRIGVIGGDRAENSISSQRLRGAERALRERGVELDFERDYEPCAFLEDAGYNAARRLLERTSEITAVFALGDVIAFGALRALADQGLSVPGDISLVGFDDTSFSQFSVPRITTIRQSAELLAERSAQILLDGMGGSPAVHEVVPFQLIERESVRSI